MHVALTQSGSGETLSVNDEPLSWSTARLETETWDGVLDEFRDSNVFQTVAFSSANRGREEWEHFTLKRGQEVVAAVQVRLLRMPLVGLPIAYVLWGPLFQRTETCDLSVLEDALKSLRAEYTVKRRIPLRVAPYFTTDQSALVQSVFERARYAPSPSQGGKHTIVLPLNLSLDELRKGMDKKWRNCLNSAEKNGLLIRQGSDDVTFDLFSSLYDEMVQRKHLADPGDFPRFRNMQSLLAPRFRTRAFIALQDGEPCAGVVCSAMGKRGIYLFGATGAQGLKNKASYLLQWSVVQFLKENGCTEYDLHGTNVQSNPGVYAFKAGLAGKNATEVGCLGPFESCEGLRSRLAIKIADIGSRNIRRLRSALKSLARDRRTW